MRGVASVRGQHGSVGLLARTVGGSARSVCSTRRSNALVFYGHYFGRQRNVNGNRSVAQVGVCSLPSCNESRAS